MVTYLNTLIAIPVTAFVVTWVVFGGCYDRVKWFKSPEGRNVMLTTASIIVHGLGLLAYLVTPFTAVGIVISTTGMVGLAVAGAWRTVQFSRAQKAYAIKVNAVTGATHTVTNPVKD